MEIERKFTIKELPADLESYPFHHIEQAYLNASPVVRVRKEDDEYYLTYKGSGMMTREESNLPLNREAYYHLRAKADGRIISKRRYLIPLPNPGFQESTGLPYPPSDYSLTIELDIFDPPLPLWSWPRWNSAAKRLRRLSCRRTGSMRTSPIARNTTIPIWRCRHRIHRSKRRRSENRANLRQSCIKI